MGSILSWNMPAAELSPPSSLANHGVLPADLLYEVLLRLPANELCRLRLVCRSWRSLTSDVGFAKAHASQHPLIACIHDDDGRGLEVLFVDLSSNNIIKRIPIDHRCFDLSSQLDLVCLTPFSGGEQCSILNPATSNVTILPGSTHGFGRGPCILGYVPSTGEYKVLRTRTYSTRSNEDETIIHLKQACDVMTLGDNGSSGRWRAKPSCPQVLVSPYSGRRVVIGGVAYFLPCRLNIFSGDMEINLGSIASFDLATEEWRQEMLRGPVNCDLPVVDMKRIFDDRYENLELAVLDSCLVMVQHGFRDCGNVSCENRLRMRTMR